MQTKFTVVQGLRGIAALWVVLFHADEGGHIPTLTGSLPKWIAVSVFECGHYGVAIFFALSGFVIAHSLSGVEMTGRYWARFMMRRSIRLDPAYWASMGLVILLAFVSAKVQNYTYAPPNAWSIAAHVAYLQELLRFKEINTVYWTLTYEIQFYAFFAAILLIRKRWRNYLLFGLALLSAAGAFDAMPVVLFVNLWGSFFVGVLARQALDDSRLLGLLFALVLLLMIKDSFGAISAITAVALWILVRTGAAETALSWRWIQFLGTISYSLYLVHNPVSGAAGYLGHKIAGVGMAGDVVSLCSIIATSIFAAWAIWKTVENPSHRLSRRVKLAPELSNLKPTPPSLSESSATIAVRN